MHPIFLHTLSLPSPGACSRKPALAYYRSISAPHSPTHTCGVLAGERLQPQDRRAQSAAAFYDIDNATGGLRKARVWRNTHNVRRTEAV